MKWLSLLLLSVALPALASAVCLFAASYGGWHRLESWWGTPLLAVGVVGAVGFGAVAAFFVFAAIRVANEQLQKKERS